MMQKSQPAPERLQWRTISGGPARRSIDAQELKILIIESQRTRPNVVDSDYSDVLISDFGSKLMPNYEINAIPPDELGFEIRATALCEALAFAAPFSQGGFEWWDFALTERSFDEDIDAQTRVGNASVALAREVNLIHDDWFAAFDDESRDFAVAGADLKEALLLDPALDFHYDAFMNHVAVIDRIDIVPEFRGHRLSKLLVDAVHRMFRGGLVLLVPSELDERERLIEAGITDSGINDRGSEVEKKRQFLRSEENFRKLQKYWMSLGFEELAGKTLYLPPTGFER